MPRHQCRSMNYDLCRPLCKGFGVGPVQKFNRPFEKSVQNTKSGVSQKFKQLAIQMSLEKKKKDITLV